MRGRRGLALIARPRLQERLAASPIVVLEAPGGYGKSTAYAQFAAALDITTIRVVLRGRLDTAGVLASVALGCRRAGLASLADGIDVEDPDVSIDRITDRLAAAGDREVLLAVDEVHRAAPAAATWLATLAGELPQGTRLVLAGRRLGPALAGLPFRHGATLVGVEELRFDVDEIDAVLQAVRGERAAPGEPEAILAATAGWPAAVVMAAAQVAEIGPPSAGALPGGVAVLRSLVDGLVSAADGPTRDLVARIADLPLLSAAVLEAVGGAGALDRLLEAGLPIRFRADGWGELPDPVRELLPARALPRDVARAAADVYARGGELAEAAALLHRAGDHDGVAALLAGQRRDDLERAGLAFFDAVLHDTPDEAVARHPQALVNLIRASERQPRLRRAWTERATRVLPQETAWRRAVDAERALDIARAGDLDAAERLAGQVLESAGGDEGVTRGRAHQTRGLCRVIRDTAGASSEVSAEFESAIAQFNLAGERGWEAVAEMDLGYGVHFTAGANAIAAEHLERALALRPAPDAARAETLAVFAEVIVELGRLDDAAVAVREASAIGHRLGDSRAIAYAAWSGAQVAGHRRDLAAATTLIEEALAHPERWFDRLAGIDFLSNASEILAVLGDEAGAREYLARAEERAAGTAREGQPLGARCRYEATFGDPAAGLRHLDELDESPFVYRSDRWLRSLLRAVCLARLGRSDEAAAMVRRAEEAAASDLGDPGRAARREPELFAVATLGAPATATALAVPERQASVTLLGRFAVERDGLDISPPPGRPATLVKLLALQGTVTTDEAIDILWPEADIDTGRARLRNLLNRVRAASGELVDRRDGALTLAEGITVDASRFEDQAAAALTARPEERASLARQALARATGELLPGDRYADWATVPRERVRRRHLALLDLVAEDAIARGDLDEAGRLLDAAISSDPLEELRYVRLARALFAQGRVRQAQRVAAQGVAVAADLGVEPGDELAALLAAFAERG